MTDAIRTEALTKSFDGVKAVDGLTLNVAEGEIFGLVGPDGAGKTTTMRLLTAIMEPTSGEAWVAGHHIVKEAEAVKEDIGYVSQRFGLYPDLTVMENIDFYADIYGVPRQGRQEKIDRSLAFSNLTPFKKRLAGNLSGGMKQKLGLACALIHTPKVLFLDEPTNGVDPVLAARLLADLVSAPPREGHHLRFNGISGRGRTRPPGRASASRQAARRGNTGRSEETYARDDPGDSCG